ncbi:MULTISPECIES: hypothetical protein [unclassified Paenibacillus]|uniref:hypothetical protein n=1 Tax=unclassified Paenibacillus TaxID=185978 RepID=UPI001AE31622|nr:MULTISPECIES: hypothetical protein [unclassified Paenibacillus]MBP1153835.1 hypothetical protein [Paenibacillus sp. PvP091]MBP1170780.1 hypothetical protein [Paenibacillus sp. PvR098]MBP2441808.1 hypothetical protein [Paenibacillus sp. PvP052]
MNNQFLVCFALLMLVLLFLDVKRWPHQSKDVKRTYVLLYAAVFALYISVMFGYTPPMPTQYFVETVSPWVFSIIHPQ